VASQLTEMFATEIDFQRGLKRGDSFTVLYEALTADGEPIAGAGGEELTGRVLAAEFLSRGRSHSALWFDGARAADDPAGPVRGGYFGLDGQSKRHAFLASPLAFSRITSGFEMRLHPILQTWREHRGVDYAAPSGTPVHSVGDGAVEFAGWQNGYGNVVEVKHANDRSTVYAHLSQIDVQKGQRVERGATLGAVGATGWATGPHLHFEFRIRDEQQDPVAMAQASDAVMIPLSAKPQFVRVARQARAELQAAASVAVAGRIDYSE
jgi:murein DD-endopeptidase MepM/ murein hydrolase activator NlpD